MKSVSIAAAMALLLAELLATSVIAEEPIDRARAKAIYDKSQAGGALTEEERQYLERAKVEMRRQNQKPGSPPNPSTPAPSAGAGDTPREQASTGLKPLTEMTREDRYKGEDGGLYGGGQNEPPTGHQLAATEALKKITPLDAQGHPSAEGKIVFISLGMSNTFGEFRLFKELADADPEKSPKVQIVNCAIGGAGVSSWAKARSGTWQQVEGRLKEAGVTSEQVQVAWIKHAEPGPMPDTEDLQYAKQVRKDLAASLDHTRAMFPNLRVAYLSSRIYGGYNVGGLRRVNPEPFAYETAFSVRWVIQDQISAEKSAKPTGPVLLWGPYLWADGVSPRKSDGLVWERKDLSNDGVHPSPVGGQKVANMLLSFFKTARGAKTWFVK